MEKLDLIADLKVHVNRLESLSKFIETLKSAEPWYQSVTVQNWVTLKISAQYLRDSLIRLKRDIE